MKKILIVIFLFPLFVNSQDIKILDQIPIDSASKDAKYDSIINAKGTQRELFLKAKLWLTDAFKSSKDVIQTEDANNGIISGKATFNYKYTLYIVERDTVKALKTYDKVASFSIKIFTKQDKAKIIITDIIPKGDIFETTFGVINIRMAKENIFSPDRVKKQVGLTSFEECISIHTRIKNLIQSFQKYMMEKAENDFKP